MKNIATLIKNVFSLKKEENTQKPLSIAETVMALLGAGYIEAYNPNAMFSGIEVAKHAYGIGVNGTFTNHVAIVYSDNSALIVDSCFYEIYKNNITEIITCIQGKEQQ